MKRSKTSMTPLSEMRNLPSIWASWPRLTVARTKEEWGLFYSAVYFIQHADALLFK
jgi:hypothetical protein